jgi:hypothetical protein
LIIKRERVGRRKDGEGENDFKLKGRQRKKVEENKETRCKRQKIWL